MKVKIQFELDLEEIIDSNNHLWCYKGRSKDEIYTELKRIFGNDLDKGMSRDVKREYKNDFQEIFNY
mgnify:CR=1 FL=1